MDKRTLETGYVFNLTRDDGQSVYIRLPNTHADLTEVCEQFKTFLLAVGFVIDADSEVTITKFGE